MKSVLLLFFLACSTGIFAQNLDGMDGIIAKTIIHPTENASSESAKGPIRGCVTGNGFHSNGYNKIYNNDHQLWQEGVFKDGKLYDGKIYLYDLNKSLTSIKTYKEGAFDSEEKQ